MIRPPFSRRQSNKDMEDFFVHREGVPDGLVASLVDFVLETAYHNNYYGQRVVTEHLNLSFARINDRHLPDDADDAHREFAYDRDFLLDVVDYVLGNLDPAMGSGLVEQLQTQLAEARSAYTVGIDSAGCYELQHRQPPELTELVKEATSPTSRESEHLQRAWSKAFGRNADPNGACLEAVQAIEVAAKPVVSPKNNKTTLGTIISDMRAKPSKWTTPSGMDQDQDVESVIAMMDFVWKGHYRHGDETDPLNVSREGAEMIVNMAVMLVHWFQRDYVATST